jgi:hypothetical protein
MGKRSLTASVTTAPFTWTRSQHTSNSRPEPCDALSFADFNARCLRDRKE